GGMTLLVSRTSNWLPLLCMAPFFACSAGSGPGGGGGASNGDGDGDGDGDVGGDGDGDGDGDINIQPGTGGTSSDKPPAIIETTLPAGFTANMAMPQA